MTTKPNDSLAAIDRLISLDLAYSNLGTTKLRIAVIGDSMIDHYIHGHFASGAHGEPIQEGCPKFVEERRVTVPGGAANAARQLQEWPGVAVALFSNHPDIQPVKSRFIVDGKHVFRHDDEEMDCEKVMEERRRTEVQEMFGIKSPDAVLIADYDKGFLDDKTIKTIIAVCNQERIPVVVDAKRPPEIYAGATLQCNAFYSKKHRIYHPSIPSGYNGVVITSGKNQPSVTDVYFPDGKEDVVCRNHIGAGDCFAIHLTLALAHDLPLTDAATIAHSAGRVYVQHEHSRPPYPHEIRKDLDPCRGKVLPISEHLPATLNALRRSVPGRIVFTNGVWRVPHAGHAWFLKWAKEQAMAGGPGSVLVVGVNDDASAAAIRPPGEFCLPLAERCELLASQSAVDWIVPFTGPTPDGILKDLKPDIVAKGHEYHDKKHLVECGPNQKYILAPPGPFEGRHATDLVKEIRHG